MKKILLLLTILLCVNFAYAETVLTGGVDYTVQSAREELIEGVSYQGNSDLINGHILDYDNQINQSYLLKGMTDLKDRTLASFSDGTYAVMMHADKLHVYYYSRDGILMYMEEKDSDKYPYKAYKYNTSSKLVNMSLRVSKRETFIYSSDKKLIAHWLGANAYDDEQRVIMTRKYAE